jgi:hypothetical protein
LEGEVVVVRLGVVVVPVLLAGRAVGWEGTVRLIIVGDLVELLLMFVVVFVRLAPLDSICVVVLVRIVLGTSVREFAAGLVTELVAGIDWFSRIILLLDGFSTFCVDTRLLIMEGVVGLLVGADGVAEDEPPPPPRVLYWAAMLS